MFFVIIMGSVTKFVLAIPRDKCEAPLRSRTLVEKIVVRHGAPPQVLTERVMVLVGNPFREFCRLLGIDQLRTSSYRLSGNGLIGCCPRALSAMMGEVLAAIKGGWVGVLSRVLAASMTRDVMPTADVHHDDGLMERCGLVNYRLRKSAHARPFIAHVDKLRLCFDEGLDDARDDLAPEDDYTDAVPVAVDNGCLLYTSDAA